MTQEIFSHADVRGMSYPTDTITSHHTAAVQNDQISYCLYEMDWVCVADYLDNVHIPRLYSVCLSSHISPLCFNHYFPWVLILHYLDAPLQQTVLEMYPKGRTS